MARLVLCLALASLAACATTADDGAPRRGPRILVLRGQEAFGAGRLREAIADELAAFRQSGAKAAVDDAAWALRQFLRGRGHPFAEVSYRYEPGEGDAVRATLEIDEGPATVVASIELRGVETFPHEVLRRGFGGPRAGLLDEDLLYVEREMEAGAASVARYYENQGFLDVRVAPPVTTFSEDRREARVVVEVEEGVRYFLQEVRLPEETAVDREALLARVRTSLGRPYTRRTPYALRARLQAVYARCARPDARLEFTVEKDATSGDVVVTYSVEPGVEVTIGEVRVEGERKTKEGFVLSRVGLEAGDLHDAEEERASFLELYKTGLFRKIEMRLEGEGEVRDLVIELDELPSLELWAEPGWGSYEQARLTLGIRERNLFGTGRSLSFETTAAVLAQRAVFQLTDPWFLGSEYAMTYSLFGNRREEEGDLEFTVEEAGIGADLSRQWTQAWSTSVGYQYRITRAEDDQGNLLMLDDDVDISSITLAAARDTRDDVFAPREGNLSRLSLEVATAGLGSQLDFLRVRFNQSTFLQLLEGTVLGLSARGGVIQPIGETEEIPLQERFLNGGENSVRSFRENELGPPGGGEGYTVATVELRQKLVGRLDLGLFADAGNVTLEASDWLEFADYRYALGFGVRYLLPIGPLRLDVAWNPDPRSDEDDERVHFSIGMSF